MEVETQRVDPLRSAYKPFSYHKVPYKTPRDIVFEFKVIYIKMIMNMTSTSLDMPSCMTIIFPPRDPNSTLQINGLKISPSEKTSKPLRRHGANAMMSESYYVNTDHIKFKGSFLPFEVQIFEGCSDQSAVAVSGCLRRKGDCWMLEAKDGEITCVHYEGGGLVDVYFAGRSFGAPLLLNQVVKFKGSILKLDCIPEDSAAADDSHSDACDKSKELKKSISTTEFEKEIYQPLYGYGEERMLVEKEQASWFNAGVRMGIGLGLGMSLGVGVGLGLVLRTYKASSSIFKKFFM